MKCLSIGDLAPQFELIDTRDKLIRLSDFRGNNVTLIFVRGFA